MVYEANGLPEPAFESYAYASDLASDDFEWAYRVGRLHTKQGRIPEAIAAMERASRIDPRVATAHWQRGLLRLTSGDLAGADADFRRSTGANPDDPCGWLGLARVGLERGEGLAAIDMLRRALSLRGGEQPYTHFLLGRAYQLANRTQEANAEFALGAGAAATWPDPFADEMLRQRVGFSSSLSEARKWIQSNEPGRAVPILEGLRRDHPEDASVTNNLADAYSGLGRHEEARRLLEAGLLAAPGNATMHLNLAAVLQREGKTAAALEEIDRALAIDPTLALAHERKGICLAAQGRYTESIAAFRSTIAYDDRNVDVRISMGEILLGLKRPVEAAEILEPTTRSNPAVAEAWIGLGRARMEQADLDGANTAFQTASRLGPKDPARFRAILADFERRWVGARRGSGGR
jgi:tetratricopeptide (TPR) repeat protein